MHGPVVDRYPRSITRHFSTSGTPAEISAEINAFLNDEPSPGATKDAAILRAAIRDALLRQQAQHVGDRPDQSGAVAWMSEQATAALNSFARGPLRRMTPAGGTTGSTFLLTADDRYLVKSLRQPPVDQVGGHDEAALLQKIWGAYVRELVMRNNCSLLPRFAAPGVTTAPLHFLGGHRGWCILHNLNPRSKCNKSGRRTAALAMADVKGLSQLYQHSIGHDFFAMQDSSLDLSRALRATSASGTRSFAHDGHASTGRQSLLSGNSFLDALEHDLAFLDRFGLCDYSLLCVKRQAADGVSVRDRGPNAHVPGHFRFGASGGIVPVCVSASNAATGNATEYVIAFIDILSEYVFFQFCACLSSLAWCRFVSGW